MTARNGTRRVRPRESQKVQAEQKRRQERRRAIATLLGAVGLVIVISAAIIVLTTQHPRTARASLPIDGIPCQREQGAYHEHAHLTILNTGRRVRIPGTVGHGRHGCLYWLHTHDASGLIHLEAPHRFVPTLGAFFDIWGQPFSSNQVAHTTLRTGQGMQIYLNQKRYAGKPRALPLRPYTVITLEVGPPFSPPHRYHFGSGY